MQRKKIYSWVVLISFGLQMVSPYPLRASTDGYLTPGELRIAQANGYVPTSSSNGDGDIDFTNLSSGNNQVTVAISSETLLNLVQDTPSYTPPVEEPVVRAPFVSVVPDPVPAPVETIGPDVFDPAYYKEEAKEPAVRAVDPQPAPISAPKESASAYSRTAIGEDIYLDTSDNPLDTKQILTVHGTNIPITSGVNVAVIANDQVMLSDKENAQHQTILTFDGNGKTTSIQNRHDGLYDLDDVITGRAKPVDTVLDAAGFLFATLTGDTDKAQTVIQDYYSPDEMAYGNWIYPESKPGDLAGMVQVKDGTGEYVTVNKESIMQSEGEGLLNPHKYIDSIGLTAPAIADWVFGKEESVTYTDASGDLQTGWVNERTLRSTDKSIVAMPDEVSKITQKVSCSLDEDGNVIYWQDNAQVADPSARELSEHWSTLQDGSAEKTILGEYILAKASGETAFTTALSVPLGLIPLPGMAAIGANGYLGNNESYAEIAAYLKAHPEVYQTQEYKNLDHQNIAAGYINGMPAPFEINTLRAIPSAFVDTSKWNKYSLTGKEPTPEAVAQPAESAGPPKIYYSADEVGAILPATSDKWSAYIPTEQRYTAMDAVTDVALAISIVSPLIGDEEGMIAAKLGNTGVKITNAVGLFSAIPIDDVLALSSKAARVNSAATKAIQGVTRAEMFVDGAAAVSDATRAQRFIQGAAKTGAVWSGVSATSDVGYSFLSGNGLPSLDEVVQSARTGFGQGFVFGGAVQGAGLVAKAAGLGKYADAVKANPAGSTWYQRWGATAADTAIKYADTPGLVADHSLAGAKSFVAVGPIFHAVGTGLGSIGESFFYDENGNWGLHWDPHVTSMKGPRGETDLPWYQDLALSAVSSPKDTGLWLGTVTEVAGITSSVLDPTGEGIVSRWAANTARDGYLRGTLKTALNADAGLTGTESAGKNWLLNTPKTAEQFLTQVDNAVFFSGLTAATDAALTSDFSKEKLGINAQDASLLQWVPFLLVPRYDGGANPGLATGDKTALSDRIVAGIEKLKENSGSKIVPPEVVSSERPAAENTKPGVVEKTLDAVKERVNADIQDPSLKEVRDRFIAENAEYLKNIDREESNRQALQSNLLGRKTMSAVYAAFQELAYRVMRQPEYPEFEGTNPDIASVTGKDLVIDGERMVRSDPQNGWHYRIPRSGESAIGKTQVRISINAIPHDGVVANLDRFFVENNIEGYYKTPDDYYDWQWRHDPITLYLKEKPTDAQMQELLDRTEPFIRNPADVLIGERIAPGVALEIEPTEQMVRNLEQEARAVDPALGDAIRDKFFYKNELQWDELSAGTYAAAKLMVEVAKGKVSGSEAARDPVAILRTVSEEKARLSPGEVTQGKMSANADVTFAPDIDNAKSQDKTPEQQTTPARYSFKPGLEYEQQISGSSIKDLTPEQVAELADKLDNAEYGTHQQVMDDYLKSLGLEPAAGSVLPQIMGGPTEAQKKAALDSQQSKIGTATEQTLSEKVVKNYERYQEAIKNGFSIDNTLKERLNALVAKSRKSGLTGKDRDSLEYINDYLGKKLTVFEAMRDEVAGQEKEAPGAATKKSPQATQQGSGKNEGGISTVIDNTLPAANTDVDHLTVYARNEFEAVHQKAELELLLGFCLKNSIVSQSDIENGQLSQKVQAWLKDPNVPTEEREQRNKQLLTLVYDSHQKGLNAQAKAQYESILDLRDIGEKLTLDFQYEQGPDPAGGEGWVYYDVDTNEMFTEKQMANKKFYDKVLNADAKYADQSIVYDPVYNVILCDEAHIALVQKKLLSTARALTAPGLVVVPQKELEAYLNGNKENRNPLIHEKLHEEYNILNGVQENINQNFEQHVVSEMNSYLSTYLYQYGDNMQTGNYNYLHERIKGFLKSGEIEARSQDSDTQKKALKSGSDASMDMLQDIFKDTPTPEGKFKAAAAYEFLKNANSYSDIYAFYAEINSLQKMQAILSNNFAEGADQATNADTMATSKAKAKNFIDGFKQNWDADGEYKFSAREIAGKNLQNIQEIQDDYRLITGG